jgi:hypothetical protein
MEEIIPKTWGDSSDLSDTDGVLELGKPSSRSAGPKSVCCVEQSDPFEDRKAAKIRSVALPYVVMWRSLRERAQLLGLTTA